MSTLQEKSEIIAKFKAFNFRLVQVLNVGDINNKLNSVRESYVDLQLRDLFRELLDHISDSKTIDQIVIELNNSQSIVGEHLIQFENIKISPSTKDAINKGSSYIKTRLESLKLEYDEKLRKIKQKNKGKYEDVIISEKEYAFFIILAEKHGLISKIPKATEKAIAFSALTNISDQTLRDNIGSKYQLDPNELFLKKDNLMVLKQTLINICDEIDLIETS